MALPRSVRIYLDGDRAIGEHVSIADAETGAPILGVTSLTLRVGVGDVPKVNLEMIAPAVDVVAAVEEVEHRCPHCGQTVEIAGDSEQPAGGGR